MTDWLGARIVSGVFQCGGTLPNEIALSETLGTSRPAVREALRVLAAKGLTASRTRVGSIVQPVRSWNLLDQDVLNWLSDGPLLDELLRSLTEARFFIEPAAAALAARRARAAQLSQIEAALDGMAATLDDSTAHLEADYAFHASVIEASGNIVFLQFLNGLRKALLESFRLTSPDSTIRADAVELHRAVYEAIRTRAEDRARLAMLALLEDAQAKLSKVASR